MKRKHFIFALVAMLSSFSFTANAQTTVSTEEELKKALTTSGEVTLGADVNVATQIEIPADVTVVLDLAGHKIIGGWHGSSTTNHIYALSNSGTLTIKDSGAEGKIVSRGVYNYGTLTLESGTIDACDGNGGYAVNNESGSTFVMNDGVVSASYEDGDNPVSGNFDATALDVPAGCTATLNGGKITSVTNFTYAISLAGKLIVPESSTVEVNGAHGAISMSGGSADIAAGTFICSGIEGQTDNVVYVSGGSMNISGGTFKHNGNNVNADSGAAVVMEGDGVLRISGGEFTGLNGSVSGNANTTLTGGSYNTVLDYEGWDDIKQYVPEGESVTIEGESYTNVPVVPSNQYTYAEFNALIMKNGNYDGTTEGTVVVLKDSERSYQNNKTAQFFIGATDVNITDPVEVVKVTSVTFQFEDDDLENNYTSGELQIFAKTIEFTNCTFIGTAVSPWGVSNSDNAETATFTNCKWQNLSGRYGVHQNRASALTVTGCIFENCERGIHTNSSTVSSITITGNTFTGIGDAYGVLCLAEGNGDLSKATLNITDNTAEGQVMLRQLSETVTYAQVAEILDTENNTYGSAYVSNSIEPAEPVAQIGEVEYKTLAEAVEAASEGQTITLITDVELTETLTIPADKTITLDLAGKAVSMVYAETATKNHTMIDNYGNLTIDSSVEGGMISYTYTGANLGTTYSANTITSEPGSVLTVKDGTIKNLTYDYATIAYAIDGLTNGNLGDVTVNIEGGVITSERQAIRIFANSTTKTGTLNISGGDITGRVIVQNANASANKAVLDITGGTFNANTYKTDVLYVGGSNSATIDITAAVGGGTFNGAITETNVTGFISGGTFTTNVTAYCAEGFVCQSNADGTYGVQEDPSYSAELNIVDGDDDSFVNESEKTVGTLTYTRTFNNLTWNALYVPFEIPMSELIGSYDVAYINDVHSYDDDDDGDIDRMTMEVIKITNEEVSLHANYPYLIRPKNEGAKTLSLELTDTKVYVAEENTVDVTSASLEFDITGSYSRRTVEDLNGKLVMGINSTGVASWITMSEGTLNPFRLTLTITNRNTTSPVKLSAEATKAIRIHTRGENDETTDIEYLDSEQMSNDIYDLQGRRVINPAKGGFYIVNGKKVVF